MTSLEAAARPQLSPHNQPVLRPAMAERADLGIKASLLIKACTGLDTDTT